MSAFENLKLNIHYRGDVEYKDGSFDYIGGIHAKDMMIDPDLMTWSIFEEFCVENGVAGVVEQVWYKLPQEDIAIARLIEENKDAGIRQLCNEASIGGEVDIYIQQSMSEPTFPANKDAEEERVEDEGEERVEDEGDDQVEDKGDDPMEEVGTGDPLFSAFYDEINRDSGGEVEDNNQAGEEALRQAEAEAQREAEENVAREAEEDEEIDRQCEDAERPEPAMDTDEEWDTFELHEKEISRANYAKDKEPYLWLKQKFHSGEDFKDQLLRYVLKKNYDVKLCRWGQTQLAAICSHKKCPWKIHCSVEKRIGKWMVKTYVDRHNHSVSGKARMSKQGVIGRLFRDEARRRPSLSWIDIKDEIMMRYTISVSKWICQKARRIAFNLVMETQRQQFAKLWDYEYELRRSNEGTSTEIVTIPQANGKQQFDKFYICFEPLRRTWKSCCRPIIGLDGAFLKWELKGEILAAVGRDADNRIYPIAWAIVRVEDNESWAWFVEKLKKDLLLDLGDGLTIMSDKQKGLINAVEELLPNAEHRHCARHIFANWRKAHGDSTHEGFFWAIAYSGTEGDYLYNIQALRKYDPLACEDLLKIDPKTWCRAFFSYHSSCEDVCNNLSESFNKTIKDARKMPVINMLEEVRRIAMKRNCKLAAKTQKCEERFPPKVMLILEANRRSSKFCSVIKSGEHKYEVLEGSGSFCVNLLRRECACNQWNLTGIPCPHAIYVITEHNRDPEDYIDRRLQTSVWQATYKDNIDPVNGERLWRKTGKGQIEVPDKRKKRGRPKKFDRIKEPGESSSNPTKLTREGKSVTCSNCKQMGHNKGTCKNQAVQLPPTRKRGRPRKRLDNDDPWSIENAPKRWHRAQTQSTPPIAQSQSTQQLHVPQHSSAPPTTSGPGNTAAKGRARGRPPGRKNGEGKGRGKGRGKGSDEPPTPRPPVFFMSPWNNKVFDVWQPDKK